MFLSSTELKSTKELPCFSLPSFVTDGKFDHKLSLSLTCRYSNSFLPIASTCTCKIKRQFIDLKKGI